MAGKCDEDGAGGGQGVQCEGNRWESSRADSLNAFEVGGWSGKGLQRSPLKKHVAPLIADQRYQRPN